MVTPEASAALTAVGMPGVTLPTTIRATRIARAAATHAEASTWGRARERGEDRRTGTPSEQGMDRIKDAFARA
jgi:hypothetical protein